MDIFRRLLAKQIKSYLASLGGGLLRDLTKAADKVFIKIRSLFSDGVNASGKCTIKCFADDMKTQLLWETTKPIPNLVVDDGLDHIADQLSDQGEGAMSHMGAGDDNTAPAAGQSDLISSLARVALDSKTQTGGNTVVYVATFGAGTATGSWEEVAIFNAASGNVMLDRLLTGTKVKAGGETFEVTITLTISAS